MSMMDGHTRKKQGVSGECSTDSTAHVEIKHYKKDYKFVLPLVSCLLFTNDISNIASICKHYFVLMV